MKRWLQALSILLTMSLSSLAFASEGDIAQSLQRGFFVALGICFLSGLGMAGTPCVWPMIPITVSIFGATESKSRLRAIGLSGAFVLGLVAFFGSIGIAVALTHHAVGGFLGKWYVNFFIGAVFLALSASMFGAFEIALPAALQNRLSTMGGIGFRGAFVLGLIMALIAAPCTTGFIVGLATEVGTRGDVVFGFSTFGMLALGMGIPFFLVGGLAVSLPKPGAWMLGIKWVCGVALAGFAIKYFSQASPSLSRLITQLGTGYAAAFVALFAVGLVLGAIHIAAERRKSPIVHLSKPMKLASLLPAVLGGFMCMTAATNVKTVVKTADAAEAPEIAWSSDDTKTSLEARAQKKPMILDFGAEWCTACKELEHKTFPDARVRKEATRFLAVRVDMTDDDSPEAQHAQSKYKVTGASLPTILLLDGDGKEVKRLFGFLEPEMLANEMHAVP